MESSETSPHTHPTHPHDEPENAADLNDEADVDKAGEGDSSFTTRAVNETTSLLQKPYEFVTGRSYAGSGNHGTFSPRLESRSGSIRSQDGFGGLLGVRGGNGGSRPGSAEGSRSLIGSLMEGVGMKSGNESGGKKKMSTTSYLAERHGIKHNTGM